MLVFAYHIEETRQESTNTNHPGRGVLLCSDLRQETLFSKYRRNAKSPMKPCLGFACATPPWCYGNGEQLKALLGSGFCSLFPSHHVAHKAKVVMTPSSAQEAAGPGHREGSLITLTFALPLVLSCEGVGPKTLRRGSRSPVAF